MEKCDWTTGLEEIAGAIHIHSNYSDGEGDVEDILSAAHEAGLDYFILTDHDCAAARREGWEGRHNGVTLIAGVEITPIGRPHCLAMGQVDCLGLARMTEHEYLDSIGRQGGFAAIAHPEGGSKPELRISHRAWSMWDHPAVKAVEIWNYTHDWVEHVYPWNFHEFHSYFVRPHSQITGPHRSVLSCWDQRAAVAPLSGIAGLDCHARSIPPVNIQVFPYRDMFKTLRTHLFVPAGRRDCDPILDAIKNAAGFVGYDYLADSCGTTLTAECECGEIFGMGGVHFCGGEMTIRLHVPEISHIRLLLNGKVAAAGEGRYLKHTTTAPGVYRAEAFLDKQPWIYTNHLYLKTFPELEQS